jgi:hypothetical protein
MRPKHGDLFALTDGVGCHKGATRLGGFNVAPGFEKPAGDIIKILEIINTVKNYRHVSFMHCLL